MTFVSKSEALLLILSRLPRVSKLIAISDLEPIFRADALPRAKKLLLVKKGTDTAIDVQR